MLGFMHVFQRRAHLDLTTYDPPAAEERTGPPLTQGFLFTLLGAVASQHCSEQMLDALLKVRPEAWYHGQLLESFLAHFERRDPDLPRFIGRNVYLMVRSRFESYGIRSVPDVLLSIPRLWTQATRGDGGEWRVSIDERTAHIEAEQPYNCLFEEGTVIGFAEMFGGKNVRVDHGPCMRVGAPFCVLDVRWEDGEVIGPPGDPSPLQASHR